MRCEVGNVAKIQHTNVQIKLASWNCLRYNTHMLNKKATMQNTITVQHNATTVTFTVTKKCNKPFSNNFVQNSATVVQYAGKDEVQALVTCTANSKEQGRIYSVSYSMQGDLLACNTVN